MAKKQHRRATVELATLALVSEIGGFRMCLAMPSRPSARWTTVASLQHVWTKDELEKQVLARPPALEQIQRVGDYTVSKEETQRSKRRVSFREILGRLDSIGRRKRKTRIHQRQTS